MGIDICHRVCRRRSVDEVGFHDEMFIVSRRSLSLPAAIAVPLISVGSFEEASINMSPESQHRHAR